MAGTLRTIQDPPDSSRRSTPSNQWRNHTADKTVPKQKVVLVEQATAGASPGAKPTEPAVGGVRHPFRGVWSSSGP
eukprot:6319259-Amphidinium_carterae.1